MQFNSLDFLIFFIIVSALAAILTPRVLKNTPPEKLMRLRHIMLLIASYVFYGWWNWKCCALMLLMTAVAYICALGWSRSKNKLYVYLGVIFPLVVLGIFKYYNFFVDSFCDAFGIVRAGSLNILLPVGISFYTFQSLSYTLDVYRAKLEPENDFIRLALYIAFFPQLVAGPIVKAGDFIPQLYEDRQIGLKNLELGVQYFAFGLFKKIVLADNISVFVDAVHRAPEAYSAITLILAVYAYGLQIYFDFSGYSDMAVGCAKALGYDLSRNFNLPYLAKNVSELWKRWHISLSSWLQEYLYISLGGNRCSRSRTYINLFLTMVIGGLWHGAAWTFVLWGALHGIALILHKQYRTLCKKSPGKSSTFGTAVSVFLTASFTCLCFMVFRADSIGKAIHYFVAMLTWQQGITHISFWAVTAIVLTCIASGAAIIRSKKAGTPVEGFYPVVNLNTVKGLVIFFCFVGLTLGLAYTGETPFIYFQF